MSAAPSLKTQGTSLLRKLLRQATRFPQLPFRIYFTRKIQDTYRDVCWDESSFKKASEELQQMKRMVTVQRLYASTRPLVIEEEKADEFLESE